MIFKGTLAAVNLAVAVQILILDVAGAIVETGKLLENALIRYGFEPFAFWPVKSLFSK